MLTTGTKAECYPLSCLTCTNIPRQPASIVWRLVYFAPILKFELDFEKVWHVRAMEVPVKSRFLRKQNSFVEKMPNDLNVVNLLKKNKIQFKYHYFEIIYKLGLPI